MNGTLFSAADACRMSGASYRQLDYWVRLGVVTPEHGPSGESHRGYGHERRFTREQVEEIRLARVMRDAGIGTVQITDALVYAREHDGTVFVLSGTGDVEAVNVDQIVETVLAAGGAAVLVIAPQRPKETQ